MVEDTAEYAALVPEAPRRGWPIASLGVLAFAATLAFRKIADWDFWWHLAIGREALTTRTSVPVDTFSYPLHGHPYVAKDLVADIVFFVLFDQAEFIGIALLKVAAVLCAFVGIRVALGRHGRPLLWVVLAFVFAAAAQNRVSPRPDVLTLGFFPLMLGLIERARRHIDPRDWSAFFVAMLPAIFLQWAWINLHRGGVIGLVLLVGLACALGLQWAMHRLGPLAHLAGPRPGGGTVAVGVAVALIAAAAGLLNPSGVALYRSALSVTHDPIHRTYISEWQPLSLELALTVHSVGTFLLVVTWLALAVRLLSALLSSRARRPLVDVWHLGVLALFTFQGVQSMRWLPFAAAAAVVTIGLIIAEALDEQEQTDPLRYRAVALPLAVLLGVAGLHLREPHQLGLGLEPERYPTRALAAADQMQLEENVHNAFVYGGYTIWQSNGRRRVLIDGRNDMVYPSEFFLRCSRAQHDIRLFAELWSETGGDWVLADNTPGRESFAFLASHPEWMTLYWSEPAVIYALRAEYPALERFAYRFVRADDPVESLAEALRAADGDPQALSDIRRELLRMTQESPEGLRANTLLALYYDHRGPEYRQQRDAVLAHLHATHPGHPAVLELTQRLLGRAAGP